MEMIEGDIIFLSASVPYREGWTEDARPADIEEAIVCVARAVFARSGRLLFGGHPSVSPLVAAIAGEYYAADPDRTIRPVITFQSEHFRGRLPDETWDLYRMGWSSIEWTPAVPGAEGQSDQEQSLKLMREWMLLGPGTPARILERNALKPPKAMIAAGGMEGIIDEADMFLRHRENWDAERLPPVYAIASGGGAAKRLLERSPDAVRGLERVWWRENPDTLPRDIMFQPYAAMAQWMMDRL
jgi:hypothetical protein